jgi:endoglucanase
MNKFFTAIGLYFFLTSFCSAQTGSPDIRLNQIGFYPGRPKTAIAVGAGAGPFHIVSADKQDTLFSGTLSSASTWSFSGETVRTADFSLFNSTGHFYVLVPGLGYSHPFEINHQIHHAASKASIKSFYYQRASVPLASAYAGIWARPEGHPDTSVMVHNSAGSFCRDPATDKMNGSRGWYDAGDYNKYVVNAGITTYSLMALYEHYPNYFDTLYTNIPESGNNIPDILNEVLWEIRWLLTMQDTCDGGVYTKLTSPSFQYTMPDLDNQSRYVVQKSTPAALDLAALLAQASRIFSRYPVELPGLADSCLYTSLAAWKWARSHPNVAYVQSSLDNPTIYTSAYPDNSFSDEFRWAAAELYTTTKLDSFYTSAGGFSSFVSVPDWSNVNTLAYYTLSHYRKSLTPMADTATIKSRLVYCANQLLSATNASAYGVSMGEDPLYDFTWGSNGNASNHGMMFITAFDQTRDTTYLNAALGNLDYLLGKNATNYSFLTGFGEISPLHIRQMISEKDGVAPPVPGFLAAGPQNKDNPEGCAYPANLTLPANKYLDDFCSYSTNEIGINWNASFAYLSGCIEAIQAKARPSVISFPTPVIDVSRILGIKKTNFNEINLSVYPNPAVSKFIVEFENKGISKVTLSDLTGKKIEESFISTQGPTSSAINVENLTKGIYVLTVTNDKATGIKKIIVQ